MYSKSHRQVQPGSVRLTGACAVGNYIELLGGNPVSTETGKLLDSLPSAHSNIPYIRELTWTLVCLAKVVNVMNLKGPSPQLRGFARSFQIFDYSVFAIHSPNAFHQDTFNENTSRCF